MPASPTPRLARIQIHPIKSLDPVEIPSATIGPAGSLHLDRAWALYTRDGRVVAFSRNPALHRIRAAYAPDFTTVTLTAPPHRPDLPPGTFRFPSETEPACKWFSQFLKQDIMVRHDPNGIPDDLIANGPTIISTASLDTIAGWFPGLTTADARLRFRATLEIDGVPPFWEDQLFGAELRSVVRFRIGEVYFEGSYPCIRCPVPARDPHTGVDDVGFQKKFTHLRRTQLPPWSHAERFEHFYCVATNTRIPSTESNKPLKVGDALLL